MAKATHKFDNLNLYVVLDDGETWANDGQVLFIDDVGHDVLNDCPDHMASILGRADDDEEIEYVDSDGNDAKVTAGSIRKNVYGITMDDLIACWKKHNP